MNVMKFLLLLGIFPFMVFAQTASQTTPQTKDKATDKLQVQKTKYPPKNEFDMRGLNDTVKQKNEEFIQKYKKLKGIEWLAGAQLYLIWSEHPYIEDASRIDRRWFKKLSQFMSGISKLKTEMEVCSERNLTERYNKAKIEYDKIIKNYLTTIKKPVMLSDENKKKQGR